MFTDHPIRAAAGRARVDRGSALYVADAPVEGFFCRPRGALFALAPGPALLAAFAAWARPIAEGDPLGRALLRLADGVGDPKRAPDSVDRAGDPARAPDSGDGWAGDRALLIDGIKLLELGWGEGALRAYEKRVRQRAAVCLRERRGGGRLWLCAACIRAARGSKD